MSRAAQNGASAAGSRLVEDGDICPVCKSSRYLNPNMRFLVNPECYHKMCESCVDRIFSHGPAPCPVAGCRRTLRKQKFRKQTFGDIQVEREVDIRRRISHIFNRQEDDFDTLHDYNNYLNEVEDITFNLINKIDVEASEKRINAYLEANRGEIAKNSTREKQNAITQESRIALERETAQRRREEALKEDEEARLERDASRRNVIDQLARGDGDARDIVRDSQKVKLKKSSARSDTLDKSRLSADAEKYSSENQDAGLVFRGLKKREDAKSEKAYDVYDGIHLEKRYFVVQDTYEWKWFDDARKEQQYVVGGYQLPDYYSRALTDAFSGLGVFVADEVS